jgi:hypothetical protein
MKKQITIYKVTFQDDNSQYYFKGIDDLRDFAESRILDGWETETTIEDLKNDENVINFITKDYGEKLDVLFTITEEDLK